VIDKTRNKVLTPDMVNKFFNIHWVDKEDREFMLGSEEAIELVC
jgi:hypothetical protein